VVLFHSRAERLSPSLRHRTLYALILHLPRQHNTRKDITIVQGEPNCTARIPSALWSGATPVLRPILHSVRIPASYGSRFGEGFSHIPCPKPERRNHESDSTISGFLTPRFLSIVRFPPRPDTIHTVHYPGRWCHTQRSIRSSWEIDFPPCFE
jgi:hypothetical protein